MDKNGWVKSLLEGQIVQTLLLSDPVGHHPAGRYILLYEGEGTIEYHDAVQKDIAASRQGHDVIEVDPSRKVVSASGSPPLTAATTAQYPDDHARRLVEI